MTSESQTPAGFLTFTLHAHLPYVVNHGTWPHGMEWLHEAAAETYLPLLRMLTRLEKDGIGLRCNLNLSPILLEQLAHPVFLAEFPKYLTRKIVYAREDEAFFTQSGESHYADTARFWHRFFTQALEDFHALKGSIVQGFLHFHRAGLIEIITCAATHGYLPLLGTDESVRAQIRVAVQTHQRHIGQHPRGIWIPECGYRPAGFWNYPALPPQADSLATAASPIAPGFHRIGVEQAVAESGISFFFVDTHLVQASEPVHSPYRRPDGGAPPASVPRPMSQLPPQHNQRSLYHPSLVESPGEENLTTVFARDPRTGVQVWSGDLGYPGEASYLDFHKKRWPGGHRYWCVTGPDVDMNDKQPYLASRTEARIREHAQHFVDLVREALQSSVNDSTPPILCSPFDAELFGHWWFEGPLWLEAVARILHADPPPGVAPLQLITCPDYLERFPAAGTISMHEGSWGAEGNNRVWINPETAWTYTRLYPAEFAIRQFATEGKWRDSAVATRILQQLCRELLLLESSDWQFLITTGAARDYAELRFLTHNDQFTELSAIYQAFVRDTVLNEHQAARLAAIEDRDGIFPGLDPALWATGARQTAQVELHQLTEA